MIKFKIGDKIVVTKCICGHDFDIGEIVVIAEVCTTDYLCIDNSGEGWHLIDTEFEIYEEKEMEQTAEQIRNEILRIDARIEEAKKDIENAQNERNSLVGKLREKGFELTGEALPYQRPTVGDRVRVVDVSDRMEDEDIVIGYEFVIERDDKSHLPFMDKQMNWFREQSVRKI